MNTNRSNLLRTAFRTLAISALPVAAHAQNIISVNFGANEPNGTISTASALTAGPVPIAGTFWNNMSGNIQAAPQSLINDLGAPSGASVTWTSANTWRTGSTGATATSLNGNLTKGYLDDGGAGAVISLNNVPFLSYNVFVIYGSDQAGGTENTNNNLRPVTINGTNFQGNNPSGTLSTSTILGGANWTGKNWTNDDSLVHGNHYLQANNQAGLTLVVRGNTGQGATGRGSISGLQIQNAYTGTTRYWDVDGSTPGAGGAAPAGTWDTTTPNWNDAAGSGTAVAWSGVNEAAVFSAGSGATGTYTVNLSGTQTTDAVILEEGNLTLSGGTLNLVNAGVIRSFTAGGTLTVTSDVTSAGSLSFDGAGSHVFSGNASHVGGTNISSTFYLSPTGNISATSSVNVNNGVSAIVDGAITASGAINLNGSSLLGEGTIVAGGNVNLNNIGTNNNLTLAGAGSLTASAGNLAINRGSATFNGNSVATLGGLNNPTAGVTTSLNINDSAQINVTNRMVLGDQSNAPINVTQTGGAVTNTGTINNPGGNDMSNRWGHWGGATTTYNLSGGSLNLTGSPLYLSWDSPATLNISGTGVANLKGVNMGFDTRVNASTINLNAGGKLNIGSDGIVTGGLTNKNINLNGGTLGALADWSTTRPMNITANTVVDTTGGNISLGGAITGTGNLTLQGGKTVVLGGVNTFTGTTTVTGNTTLLFGLLGGHSPTVTVEPGSTIGGGNLGTPGVGVANNIVAQNGSKSVFRISSGVSDQINVLDLNIDTSHTLTIIPTGVVAANTVIPVIDYATLTGTGYAGINVVSGNPRLTISKEPDDGSTLSVKVDSFDSMVWKGTDGTSPTLWDINTTQNWQTDATLVGTKFLQNDLVLFNDTATTTAVTLVGAVAPASTAFNNSTLNYSLAGSGIGGTGGLTKDGTGTLELRNDNTYLGNTVVTDGLLRIGDGTSGSIANGTVQVDGGNLEVKMAAAGTYARPTTLAVGTSLTFTGAGDLTSTATLSGDGNLVVDRAGTVLHSAVGTLLLGTVTVNSGTLAVDANQGGTRFANNKLITVNPGAAFEYRGVNATPIALNSIDLVVTSGTLRSVSGASALATDSHGHMRNITLDGSTMELNYAGTGTAYNGESIQLNGGFNVVGTAPSVINTGVGGNATNTGIALIGAGNTFTIADVTGTPAADLTVNAELEPNDGGGGILNKAGAGTMVLNNACSYTGATNVQAGALLVNSTLASNGITVSSGATLGGTGSTAAPLTVSVGGTVAPGASAGDLAVGTTILSGSYACEIDGLNADTLVVTGNLDLTGSTLTLSVLGGGATEASYLIASYSGTLTGTFGTVTGLPSGYAVNYDTPGEIRLVSGSDAYGDWETANGIAGAGAEIDSDGDGIPNGIEFVIGGDPSGPASDSSALLPTITTDATYLNFTFRRSDDSTSYGPFVEYGSDLTGWTEAEAGVNGVVINEIDDGFGVGVDSIEVKLPRALAVGARLFSRLKVTIP